MFNLRNRHLQHHVKCVAILRFKSRRKWSKGRRLDLIGDGEIIETDSCNTGGIRVAILNLVLVSSSKWLTRTSDELCFAVCMSSYPSFEFPKKNTTSFSRWTHSRWSLTEIPWISQQSEESIIDEENEKHLECCSFIREARRSTSEDFQQMFESPTSHPLFNCAFSMTWHCWTAHCLPRFPRDLPMVPRIDLFGWTCWKVIIILWP